MAIDIHKETLMTLEQASQMLPLVRSTKIHTSTLWRWCKRGFRGVYLEYAHLGRRIVTSSEALGRFFAALAELDSKPMPPAVAKRRRLRPRSSDKRLQEIEAANATLRRAGILKP